ncbi:hypothetical protein SEA_TUNATARTARE_124 [Streptomyces phage TunaTartare]|uniref:Uncharacterized protein n=1 Tax=Streptomyces phage TunaTartare TaxID=2848887 RepID=A0A8F2E6P4_9CAUD|nr:hypothetical protein PP457_gp139 [Streptomyces phage TunaTartare]QWT30003.1 hypothetical protein SEA_TUNATARTARE_124 [Streptomyces phage TunaTartare]
MASREEVIEAIETLDGLQPSWYREILENGPRGDEEYTLYGDDLGSVIYAISVLKEHFGIKDDNEDFRRR